MTDEPYRILTHGADNIRTVSLMVDGTPIAALADEPLAAALLAHGIRVCRTISPDHAARGVFCGIGVCGDCVMQVNDVPGIRACVTPVQDGMRVETQQGTGAWQFVLSEPDSTR